MVRKRSLEKKLPKNQKLKPTSKHVSERFTAHTVFQTFHREFILIGGSCPEGAFEWKVHCTFVEGNWDALQEIRFLIDGVSCSSGPTNCKGYCSHWGALALYVLVLANGEIEVLMVLSINHCSIPLF